MIHFGFMVLDKMKSYVLLLALLQALGCSGECCPTLITLWVDTETDFLHVFVPAGVPVYNSELESMANRGLGAALTEVNSVYAVSHLYRVTRGSVSRVSLLILFKINLHTTAIVQGLKSKLLNRKSFFKFSILPYTSVSFYRRTLINNCFCILLKYVWMLKAAMNSKALLKKKSWNTFTKKVGC